MHEWLQVLANGVLDGCLLATMGLAFALTYHSTGAFHLSLGALHTLAPYVALSLLGAGAGWPVAVIAALLLCALGGLLCEEVLHWPLTRKAATPEVQLIASLGMYLALVQVVVLIWGNDSRALRMGTPGVFAFLGIRLSVPQVVCGAAGVSVCALILAWIAFSSIGLRTRAMASSPLLLGFLGDDVRGLRRIVFLMTGAMAAAASLPSAFDVGFDPHQGLKVVLLAIVATVVGGRESLAGAVLAGFLLGVMRSQVGWILDPRWQDLATFLVLAGFLFFRPEGLMGRRMRLEEAA